MIYKAIYTLCNTELIPPASIYFGSAPAGVTGSYIVFFKVDDLERPLTLCNAQGDTGEALFQFSGYVGGGVGAANPSATVELLEDLKSQINQIKGVIGTAPDDYRIWDNVTGGVRLLGDGSSSLGVWGAFFEMTLRWEKL